MYEQKYIDKFWLRVTKTDHCWAWSGAHSKQGYGQAWMGIGAGVELVHRVSWKLAHAIDIPQKRSICHHCDNPGCLRPDHLFCGTQRDNALDMVAKGRGSNGGMHGAAHPLTSLTDQLVIDMRAQYASGVSIDTIASEIGVQRDTIYPAISGRTWKHLPGACKRRMPSGRDNHNARLTDAKVLAAHAAVSAGASVRTIARQLGVSDTALHRAFQGKSWKHLNLSLPGKPQIKLSAEQLQALEQDER